MKKLADIGIIGGTGLGDVLLREGSAEPVPVDTPFGPPSSTPLVGHWEGADVVFLSRHGQGHTHCPSAVPFRANIWALKTLGVRQILASGATGSLRETIEPGHLVICDQVIDRTWKRASTFFDEGVAVHVEMAEPFCPRLRNLLGGVAQDTTTDVHLSGTYVCMEGPQFSTRAESEMHRAWGGDLIGMTCMPEAKLAREAEMCYALIALPTDYDCWRDRASGSDDNLLQEIIDNLNHASARAIDLMRRAVTRLADSRITCRCGEALRLAIWTDRAAIGEELRARLRPIIRRYLADST